MSGAQKKTAARISPSGGKMGTQGIAQLRYTELAGNAIKAV